MVKVYHEGVFYHILIGRTSSAQEILAKFNGSVGKEFPLNKVFIIHNNEKINLVDFMAIKDLAEFLYDGKEFHIIENFKEGIIDVVVKFDCNVRTFEFGSRAVLGRVISKCEQAFNLNFDDYQLKFEDMFYDRLDQRTKLDEITSEFTMLFEVVKPRKQTFAVDLFVINDKDYAANKQKVLCKFESDHYPSSESIVDILIATYGFKEENMSFFKVNAFDEPIKRMDNIFMESLKNFEVDGKIKIMVKGTRDELDFELKNLVVYTAPSYPEDLQKQFEIKVSLSSKIKKLKTKILAQLKTIDQLFDDSADKFTFQVLNAFNLPGKYLIKDDNRVGKSNFVSNKILIRPISNEAVPKQSDTCVFLRKRISEERRYEGYTEVLIPEKLKNINPKNFDAFKALITSSLNLPGEEATNLKLAIVDYKNFAWKIMDGRQTHIKDGDEIGYVLKRDEQSRDDFQTEELTALKFSNNRQNYIFNYKTVKEKPFSINLEG